MAAKNEQEKIEEEKRMFGDIFEESWPESVDICNAGAELKQVRDKLV